MFHLRKSHQKDTPALELSYLTGRWPGSVLNGASSSSEQMNLFKICKATMTGALHPLPFCQSSSAMTPDTCICSGGWYRNSDSGVGTEHSPALPFGLRLNSMISNLPPLISICYSPCSYFSVAPELHRGRKRCYVY